MPAMPALRMTAVTSGFGFLKCVSHSISHSPGTRLSKERRPDKDSLMLSFVSTRWFAEQNILPTLPTQLDLIFIASLVGVRTTSPKEELRTNLYDCCRQSAFRGMDGCFKPKAYVSERFIISIYSFTFTISVSCSSIAQINC